MPHRRGVFTETERERERESERESEKERGGRQSKKEVLKCVQFSRSDKMSK